MRSARKSPCLSVRCMGVFGKMGYLQGEKFDVKFKPQITSRAVGTFVNDCLEIDGSLSWR